MNNPTPRHSRPSVGDPRINELETKVMSIRRLRYAAERLVANLKLAERQAEGELLEACSTDLRDLFNQMSF